MGKRRGTSLLAPVAKRPSKDVSVIRFAQKGGVIIEPLINWNLVETFAPKTSKNLKCVEKRAVFKVEHNFKQMPSLMMFQASIDDAFETTIKTLIANAKPEDKFSCTIDADGLGSPIYLRPGRVSSFDKKRFLDQVFKTSQSNKDFLNSGLFTVKTVIYESVSGSGRSTRAPKTYSEENEKKDSVVKIRNEDNSCGYRALALGILFIEGVESREWRRLRESNATQRDAAENLCQDFGLDINQTLSIEMITELQERIDYQIIVIDARTGGQLFKGPLNDKTIFLLYDNEHYDMIKSMTGFLRRQHYCQTCNRGFNDPAHHRCESVCKDCRT